MNPAIGPDFTLHIGRAVYLRKRGEQQQQRGRGAPASAKPLEKGGSVDPNTVIISTTTELGSERVRRYGSGEALAAALVAALSEHEADAAPGHRVVADARVLAGQGGVVGLCSVPHLARQSARGLLHCGDCGGFFIGGRGLREHQMKKHGRDFEEAMGLVDNSKAQIVAFAGRTAAGLAQTVAWACEAAREAAAKEASSSDAGLEAAKAGDLAALEALVAGG